VLKAETDQTVSELKAEQAALITNLQNRIDSESALRSQLNDESRTLELISKPSPSKS
jgi:hypothetical protein